MTKALEVRSLARVPEVRAEGDASRIVGYGAVYSQETVIGDWWRESIAPGAFARAIRDTDVRALFNHDPNYVLGRTASGTMTLSEDETGLRYDIVPNLNDDQAASVLAMVARGDVTGSSIGFTVKSETWTKPATPNELPLRTITEVDWLRDVGPVTFPAYEQTTAEARSAADALAQKSGEAARVLVELALDEAEV